MTIVIALRDEKNERIILGADSQSTQGQLIHKGSSKIFSIPIDMMDEYGRIISRKEIHIGFSGNMFFHTFLEYGFDIPKMKYDEDFIEYLYKAFFPTIQENATAQQLVEVQDNQIDTGSSLIMVFEGNIYHIQYNLGVNLLDDDFLIVGSGYEVALGSLCTNLKYHSKSDYEEIVKQAILVTGENTIYCDENVQIKIIEY